MTYDRPTASASTNDDAARRRIAMLFALLTLVASSFALTACNTASGFGQDVENTGETISGTADDVEDDL